MSDKVELKEKIQAVDQNIRELWDALDPDNQKALKSEFFILNRYISNAKTNKTEIQQHFVLTVNEYFNKHWKDLQKHPKLLWLLLCMCSYDGKSQFYHEWIGFKRKPGTSSSKKVKFLLDLYPHKKQDECELLADLMTMAEFKELAKDHGKSDEEINAMLK